MTLYYNKCSEQKISILRAIEKFQEASFYAIELLLNYTSGYWTLYPVPLVYLSKNRIRYIRNEEFQPKVSKMRNAKALI